MRAPGRIRPRKGPSPPVQVAKRQLDLLSARPRGRRASMKGGFMSSRDLPARPNLDHLKHEAKALQKAFEQGDTDARRRIHELLGELAAIKLSDAQRVIAREYGFPTWARLRDHIRESVGGEEAVAAFLTAVNEQDAQRAKRVLRDHPAITRESLHVAAALGLVDEARRL